MGVCMSCLGRKKESFDEDEESRLLFDDPNNLHYGSFSDQPINGQEDAVEIQRENEALQRVVAKTSDNMVDIFEIAPQDPALRPAAASFAYAGQEARIVRYQHLLSKLSGNEDGQDLVTGGAGVHVDWPEETPGTPHGAPSIKSESDEPLVGTFADAAAAMS
ncbi:late endosomal/lysosomal adaptor and MAPK and MTOR activator-domain-containing protein [Plectosphaerella plurivora]|uniref:Late endosomal/lysosomal adaptor and MAPK and MTOR activator-domain-containing protein n=1 Tax=Plectosphaerella plurivora TaxID=936078 RepID=A0A9P9AAD6_9PEZI|nr:late endosomal/lysosomal adaptor and MAPK and MTOR activator-domain-containing protein [Plectosphaerella plurivora]